MNSERAEQAPLQGQAAAPGAQLKAQRIAMGWSVEQVADQLKLAPRQVSALEEGDAAALPNLAVVRGFIRAYAKVVRLDAAPLVAMIDVNPLGSQEAAPARREISATFSENRFPSMTQRSSRPTLLIAGAVAALVLAALGAYQLGYISPAMLNRAASKDAAPSASAVAAPAVAVPGAAAPGAAAQPVETTLLKPGQEVPLLQSTTVPLVSVAPPAGTAAADAPAATPAAPAVPAAPVAANALVLNVRQDSWVEIRRTGAAPLVSRMMRAGSSETFDITEPVLLIVGKPAGVDATLRGAQLVLTPVPGGTTSRLNIK